MGPAATAPTRPVATGIAVLLLMVAMFLFDRFLAGVETRELGREARGNYAEGMRLLTAGNVGRAVDRLYRARTLVNRDREYALGLAQALIASGRYADANAQLREVLNEDSNDGRANLLMARLTAAENRPAEADAYYHRAIYGSWRSDPQGNRLRVRLELAAFLARLGASQELLSELLILQARAESDPALARTVGHLFLQAGSPSRSADAFKALIKANPHDGDAYKGLGEAELAEGNYPAAQNAFLHALRADPSDTSIARRVQFANRLARLDPTPRRLTSAEKYRRSVALLESTRALLTGCSGADSPEVRDLVAAADQELKSRRRSPMTNEVTEERLNLAERMWEQVQHSCAQKAYVDDPIAIIMRKLKVS